MDTRYADGGTVLTQRHLRYFVWHAIRSGKVFGDSFECGNWGAQLLYTHLQGIGLGTGLEGVLQDPPWGLLVVDKPVVGFCRTCTRFNLN